MVKLLEKIYDFILYFFGIFCVFVVAMFVAYFGYIVIEFGINVFALLFIAFAVYIAVFTFVRNELKILKEVVKDEKLFIILIAQFIAVFCVFLIYFISKVYEFALLMR